MLGYNLLDQMRRVQQKAREILARMESEGDHRGSIVALREERECIESLGEMLSRAPNGLDLAAIPDDVLRGEAERRGLKLEYIFRVVYTDQSPIRNPVPLEASHLERESR